MNWDKYDQWRLASPYENEVEVFKAENYEFYSLVESSVEDFDTKMQEYEASKTPSDYETREEYLEDSAENLADELGLYSSEFQAIEAYE